MRISDWSSDVCSSDLPYLYKSMRYDSFKDFAPITQLADVPLVLVVPESSSVHTVQDLVKLGKTRPLNFGSAGTASAQQLAGESFKVRSGLAMQIGRAHV